MEEICCDEQCCFDLIDSGILSEQFYENRIFCSYVLKKNFTDLIEKILELVDIDYSKQFFRRDQLINLLNEVSGSAYDINNFRICQQTVAQSSDFWKSTKSSSPDNYIYVVIKTTEQFFDDPRIDSWRNGTSNLVKEYNESHAKKDITCFL